jgi:hypothetical protein
MDEALAPPVSEAPDAPERFRPRPGRRRRWVVRGGRWMLELGTVFVGVYGAFLFNNYQLHRQERERREQILSWMEEDCAEQLASAREERVKVQKDVDDLNRQLKDGEMPALYAFTWNSDYDPSDVASLLTSGGFDLLEVQTVRDIKDVESIVRQMVGVARHDQQLSDTYILPNLDKDRSVFYDPSTKELRPSYRWFPEFFEKMLKSYDQLEPQLEKLQAQIRAERQRNR